jgi:hypothetical protein
VADHFPVQSIFQGPGSSNLNRDFVVKRLKDRQGDTFLKVQSHMQRYFFDVGSAE